MNTGSQKTAFRLIDQLEAAPARAGAPPRMTPNNPQEQLDQFPQDFGVIERLAQFSFSLAQVVERPTQIAPPGSRALTLDAHNATADRNAFMVDLEFAHIHNPPIGSLHMTLPPEVRAVAIRKGWALRHPLAERGVVSPNVSFVFAPRDDAERAVVELLLLASHAHASKAQ
jgi:hypothetical protein